MTNEIKRLAQFAWDYLIPHFTTYDVAIERISDGNRWGDFEIVCCLCDVEPGERFDGVATVDSFEFLGLGITYRIGNYRPWGAL